MKSRLQSAVQKKFPLPFNIGDLNWIDTYREDPAHKHLMIRFCWATGIPCYFVRDGKNIQYVPNYNYSCFQIQHPKLPSQDVTW